MKKGGSVKYRIDGILGLDTSELTSGLKAAQKELRGLKMGPKMTENASKMFAGLYEAISDFELKSKRVFENPSELKAAEKSYDLLQSKLKDLGSTFKNIDLSRLKISAPNFVNPLVKGEKAIEEFDKKTKSAEDKMLSLQASLKGGIGLNKVGEDATKVAQELIKAAAAGEDAGRKFAALKSRNTKLDVSASDIAEEQKRLEEYIAQLEKAKRVKNDLMSQSKRKTVDTEDGKRRTKTEEERDNEGAAVAAKKREILELNRQIKESQAEIVALEGRSVEVSAENKSVIDEMEGLFKDLQNASKSVDLSQIFDELPEEASGAVVSVSELKSILQKLSTSETDKVAESVEKVKKYIEETSEKTGTFGKELENSAKKGAGFETLEKQVESLRRGMLNFFSLTNGWNLLKRGISNAVETVKELDAAMTEIAVVSDYSLKEVWSMRDAYSNAATEMGAKTIDMVDATKLYVQQGLNLAEAQEVATETIKMARIAGLDGAEATDLMTAAVRGFRMELSEANRVNDVYSELAAKTASDTREIAVAMSKTASIASNAGAEFGNMSAFLAQIIEATREAPETAGTAMKTIIARFQELKKPLSEMEEVDGEMIDANAIDKALKTAGVSLKKANGEFRDFDDVILELSGKWNSLDKMTQRYIATTAAGSRQQSRFIALVQDNARLTELVGYAADSQGAANRQFEKTTDSLQSKLNKLDNAMKMFFTNLLDSDVIKFLISSLTNVIELVNLFAKAMGSLPGILGTVAGSLATLGMGVAGLAIGKGLVSAIVGGLGKAFLGGDIRSTTAKLLGEELEDVGKSKVVAQGAKSLGGKIVGGIGKSISAIKVGLMSLGPAGIAVGVGVAAIGLIGVGLAVAASKVDTLAKQIKRAKVVVEELGKRQSRRKRLQSTDGGVR